MLNVPTAPDGYKYGLDPYGNLTTVLYKIEDTVAGVMPSQVQGYVTSAISNLSTAQAGLSTLVGNLPSYAMNVFNETTNIMSSVKGILTNVPMLSDVTSMVTQLTSAGGLVDTALGKLDSLKAGLMGQVSGQLAGIVDSCKWATQLASDYIKSALSLLKDGLSGIQKAVSGFISDASKQLEAAASNLGPSFDDTVASIKDGSIFTALKKDLGSMVTTASVLPANLAAALNSTLGIDAGAIVPNSVMDLLGGTVSAVDGAVTMAADSISNLASIAQTSASSAITSAVSGASDAISSELSSLTKSISSTASSFGVPVAEMAAAVEGFTSELASLGGEATAAGQAFLADPINAAKNVASNALNSAVSAVTQKLNSAVVAPLSELVETAIADVKAKAFAAQLASVNITPITEAVEKTVNPAMYDKLNIMVEVNKKSQEALPALKKEHILAGLPKPKNYAPSEPTGPANPNDKVYKQEVIDFLAMVEKLNSEVNTLREKAESETSELMHRIDIRKAALKQVDSNSSEYNPDKVAAYRIETQELVNELNANQTYKEFRAKYEEFIAMNDAYSRYVLGAYTYSAPRSTIPEEVRAKMSMETVYKSATS